LKKKKTAGKRRQKQNTTGNKSTTLVETMIKHKTKLWRADSEKPMRTGHKKGEMQLSCFS
jgi:hypothetical protein